MLQPILVGAFGSSLTWPVHERFSISVLEDVGIVYKGWCSLYHCVSCYYLFFSACCFGVRGCGSMFELLTCLGCFPNREHYHFLATSCRLNTPSQDHHPKKFQETIWQPKDGIGGVFDNPNRTCYTGLTKLYLDFFPLALARTSSTSTANITTSCTRALVHGTTNSSSYLPKPGPKPTMTPRCHPRRLDRSRPLILPDGESGAGIPSQLAAHCIARGSCPSPGAVTSGG